MTVHKVGKRRFGPQRDAQGDLATQLTLTQNQMQCLLAVLCLWTVAIAGAHHSTNIVSAVATCALRSFVAALAEGSRSNWRNAYPQRLRSNLAQHVLINLDVCTALRFLDPTISANSLDIQLPTVDSQSPRYTAHWHVETEDEFWNRL